MSIRHSSKHEARQFRHNRVRANISGTAKLPRLVVSRSVKHIVAQLVDDRAGKTLVMVSDRQLATATGTKSERATAVGKLLAEQAKAKNILTVVFDRGGHRFHGRVKALAESARQAGLIF